MQNCLKPFLVVACFFAVTAVAQQSLYLVKLKSGVVLKCEVLKTVPDSFIVVKQYDIVSRIPVSDILSIELSEIIRQDAVVTNDNNPGLKKKVIYRKNVPDTGWSLGFQMGLRLYLYDGYPNPGTKLCLNALRGAKGIWQIGINLGAELYSEPELFILTASLEGRAFMRKNQWRSPFFYCQGGYGYNVSMALLDRPGSGTRGALGMGKMVRTRSQQTFSLMAGLFFQNDIERVSQWINWGRREVTRRYMMPGVEAKVEWSF